jgi:hypothetical protein
MQHWKLLLIASTYPLAELVCAQMPVPAVVESVKSLAQSRASVDICLMSIDFRKLPDAIQRQTVDISNRIDHLANDLHESPGNKMLVVSYNNTVSTYKKSADFRKQLRERYGSSACEFKLITELDSISKRSELLIKKHLLGNRGRSGAI